MKRSERYLRDNVREIFPETDLWYVEAWVERDLRVPGWIIESGIETDGVHWGFVPARLPPSVDGRYLKARYAIPAALRGRLRALSEIAHTRRIPLLGVRRRYSRQWGVFAPVVSLEIVFERIHG